jgi:hypothetical protein
MLTGGFQNTAAGEQLFRTAPDPRALAKKPAGGREGAGRAEWYEQAQPVDVTTVSLHPEEVAAPRLLSVFGQKIDLAARIHGLQESYLKNYGQTRSHNLMVARFAEFKAAALGALLSVLGCSQEELQKLQKKAVSDAAGQNKILFAENEYNGELLSLVGGSKKRLKTQNKVLGEIRNQLLIQAENLGLGGHYTRERILEIRLEQCVRILEKFREEKENLEYQCQLSVFGVN